MSGYTILTQNYDMNIGSDDKISQTISVRKICMYVPTLRLQKNTKPKNTKPESTNSDSKDWKISIVQND